MGFVFSSLLAAACGAAAPADETPPADTNPPPAGSAENKDDAPAQPGDPAAPGSTTPPGPAKTDLFVATFGDKKNPPVVFIHGGPGANSVGFETAAADALAAKGFFVVAYDQRGCGRSPNGTIADYSYQRSADDLDVLIRALDLKAPILLPHSFGGSIALRFMELHPNVAKGIVMVGSPMNFPQTYLTILDHSMTVYRQRLNFPKANETQELKDRMFPQGLAAAPFTYGAEDILSTVENMHSASLVFPSRPTVEAMKVFAKMQLGGNRSIAQAVNPELGEGFQKNDKVGWSDFTPLLIKHKAVVHGIYGDEDRIFSREQLNAFSGLLGADHFTVLSSSSHFSYVDQPSAFVNAAAKHISALK